MKSLLPIVFIVLILTGAIAYSLAKKAAPRDINRFGISANQLDNITTPKFKYDTAVSTTPPAPKFTISPTVTPETTPSIKADLPEVTEATSSSTKGGKTLATSRTIRTTVCTPVYGMANTCTEHVVVDTGASDSALFNLAGISYIGGLLAFVKAKATKK